MAKGFQARRILAERDERPAERFRGVLERAPVVDDHGFAANAHQARDQFLHEDGLAGSRFPGDSDVVITGVVGERRPARGLPPAAQEQQHRRVFRIQSLAPPFAVQRRQVDGGRTQQRLHSTHAGQVGVEAACREHRQAREPGRELQETLCRDSPALAVIDGAHRLFGLVDDVRAGINGREVGRLHQPLPVFQALGDEPPISRLFRQARQIAGDAGARLLRRSGRFQERFLSVGGIAGHDGQTGQHRAPRLQKLPVKIPDERIASPARPDVREGERGQHPHRHVFSVGVVKHERVRRHRKRPSGRSALGVKRIPGGPAPHGPQSLRRGISPCSHPGSDQFGSEREQCIGFHPPRVGAGRGERALECAPETPERGFRRRSREARQAHRDEHAVIRARERRTPRMQWAPPGVAEEPLAAFRDDRMQPSRLPAAVAPGRKRRAEPGARPVNDLNGAAIGRRIPEHACQRAERFGIDPGERRDFEHEPVAGRVDVEFRALVPGPPRQQLVQRVRARGRRPRRHGIRSLEEIHQPRDHRSCLQPAGSNTALTQLASW